MCHKIRDPDCLLFQLLSLFTAVTAIFDLYCLSMAAPGSTHYGYYIISYEFVYVGNPHGMCFCILVQNCYLNACPILVRNALAMFAVFSFLGALVILVTSIILIVALRKVLNVFFIHVCNHRELQIINKFTCLEIFYILLTCATYRAKAGLRRNKYYNH